MDTRGTVNSLVGYSPLAAATFGIPLGGSRAPDFMQLGLLGLKLIAELNDVLLESLQVGERLLRRCRSHTVTVIARLHSDVVLGFVELALLTL